MGRPIKALNKERVGYASITIRLPYRIMDALNALPEGKRAEFIRIAIDKELGHPVAKDCQGEKRQDG